MLFCFRSEGQLCLSKDKYSASNFENALTKLLNGDFRQVICEFLLNVMDL